MRYDFLALAKSIFSAVASFRLKKIALYRRARILARLENNFNKGFMRVPFMIHLDSVFYKRTNEELTEKLHPGKLILCPPQLEIPFRNSAEDEVCGI